MAPYCYPDNTTVCSLLTPYTNVSKPILGDPQASPCFCSFPVGLEPGCWETLPYRNCAGLGLRTTHIHGFWVTPHRACGVLRNIATNGDDRYPATPSNFQAEELPLYLVDCRDARVPRDTICFFNCSKPSPRSCRDCNFFFVISC